MALLGNIFPLRDQSPTITKPVQDGDTLKRQAVWNVDLDYGPDPMRIPHAWRHHLTTQAGLLQWSSTQTYSGTADGYGIMLAPPSFRHINRGRNSVRALDARQMTATSKVKVPSIFVPQG